jgi:hypothetical protein
LTARPQDTGDRQAILLRASAGVQVFGNKLTDPTQAAQADSRSQSPLVGLEATRDITLDGVRLPDAPRNEKKK